MKLKSIEANIEQLLTRVLAADNERLVKTYETKIGELEEEKVRLKEMLGSNRATPGAFADSFRTALGFLANPCRLWTSGEYEHKKLVLKLVLADKIPYHLKEGFRTAPIARPIRLLGDIQRGKYEVVAEHGTEPASAIRDRW